MKKLTLAMCATALLLYACNNEKGESKETATSDTTKTKSDMPDPCAGYVPDTTVKMDTTGTAAWMAAATPGEMHAMLAKSDGEWDSEVTHWMDPAAPPTKSKSSATNKMILDGRFQYSEHSGCMMGMPFHGVSLVGYDNLKKVFTSTWVDNMGTMMMNLEGPYDPVTKTIKLSGNCTNPMTGGQMKIKEEFTIVDDNTEKMVMYGPDMKGKEFKMMEITFTRKK
jgi:hypothetical protein